LRSKGPASTDIAKRIRAQLERLATEARKLGIELEVRPEKFQIAGTTARLFRAPGRVNIIGDHTDYNGGLVLPAAIQLATYLACVPATGVFLVSEDQPGFYASFPDQDFTQDSRGLRQSQDGTDAATGTSLGSDPKARLTDNTSERIDAGARSRFGSGKRTVVDPLGHSAAKPRATRYQPPPWSRYVEGVISELEEACRLHLGLAGVIVSDLPPGRGLSSSAALEVCVAVGASSLGGYSLDDWSLAELCRRAEERFAGVECGIMDQAVSVMGRAGFACLIDTWKSTLAHVPVPPDIELVVIDTGVRRSLAHTPYNQRRKECKEALERLAASRPFRGLKSLSHLSDADLPACERILDETHFRRVRHVINENRRVREVAALMESLCETGVAGSDQAPNKARDDLLRSIEDSHRSLVEDYECGHPLTDEAVRLAAELEGYLGARQTGAGWGGSVVALFARPYAEAAALAIVDKLAGAKERAKEIAGPKATAEHAPAEQTSGTSPEALDHPSAFVCSTSDGAGELHIPDNAVAL
jgi:galactokinase